MTDKITPYATARDRALSVSTFRKFNDQTQKNYYSVCLQRSYKVTNEAGQEEWRREQINLFPDELLNLAALCTRAHNELTLKIQQEREANKTPDYPAQEMDYSNVPF